MSIQSSHTISYKPFGPSSYPGIYFVQCEDCTNHSLLIGTLVFNCLGLPRERRESMEPDVYFKSPVLSLLLKWCQAVCGYYDMKVSIR